MKGQIVQIPQASVPTRALYEKAQQHRLQSEENCFGSVSCEQQRLYDAVGDVVPLFFSRLQDLI